MINLITDLISFTQPTNLDKESLSVIESIAKIKKVVNECIAQFNNLENKTDEDYRKFVEKLEEYRTEINTKFNKLIVSNNEFKNEFRDLIEDMKKFNITLDYIKYQSEFVQNLAKKNQNEIDKGTVATQDQIKNINSQLSQKAYKTYITPEEFGCESGKECASKFQDMINYAHEHDIPMRIGKNSYIINQPLTLYSGLTFEGSNGTNAITNSCHIKYIGSGFLFPNSETLVDISFQNLTFLGNEVNGEYTNSCLEFSCERGIIDKCSFLYFNTALKLKTNGTNVVENIISNNTIQFVNKGIECDNINANGYLYSDSIIDNNVIATYKEYGIVGFYAQFKITNNQIYTNVNNYKSDIYFGGFANEITNNNFGGFNINVMYDNIEFPGNLDENNLSDNMFLSPPKGDNNLYNIVLRTNTVISLQINDNIFGCKRFKNTGNGVKYGVYCKGTGYQSSYLNNNLGISINNIGGEDGSRFTNIHFNGYDYDLNRYIIGRKDTYETLRIGKSLEIKSSNGVPSNNEGIGNIISDITNGEIYISKGSYGNRRLIYAPEGNAGYVQMTSNNKIRYTTNIDNEYPVGDLIIDMNNGDLYISKGSYGNKKVLLEG